METDATSADAAAAAPLRSASLQPNERLLLHVHDFALASRLLNVRVYQVLHANGGEYVGYRVAATDEVENDYALFVSRAKGEQLLRSSGSTVHADAELSPEAVASGVLAHLDIVGNRHRDVGRLVCKEPVVAIGRKERTVPPPRTPTGSSRNAHLPSKGQDKRASRNKQSQRRAKEQIAAAHESAAESSDGAVHGEEEHSKTKSRKSSEASLLKRMANAGPTTVWRAELEGIDDDTMNDDAEESGGEEEEGEGTTATVTLSAPPAQYRRAPPERKTKHKGLQERRDKERYQRLQMSKAEGRSSPPRTRQSIGGGETGAGSSPPRQRQISLAKPHAASAAIGNALALKTFQLPEQEQFLRRKTVRSAEKRVLKVEGVFDDALGVEITSERPVRRGSEDGEGGEEEDEEEQFRRPSSKYVRESIAARGQRRASEPASVNTGENMVKMSPRPEEAAMVDEAENNIHSAEESEDSGAVGEEDDEASEKNAEQMEDNTGGASENIDALEETSGLALLMEENSQAVGDGDEGAVKDGEQTARIQEDLREGAIGDEPIDTEAANTGNGVYGRDDDAYPTQEGEQAEAEGMTNREPEDDTVEGLRSPRLISPRQQVIEIEEQEEDPEETTAFEESEAAADTQETVETAEYLQAEHCKTPPPQTPRSECWEETPLDEPQSVIALQDEQPQPSQDDTTLDQEEACVWVSPAEEEVAPTTAPIHEAPTSDPDCTVRALELEDPTIELEDPTIELDPPQTQPPTQAAPAPSTHPTTEPQLLPEKVPATLPKTEQTTQPALKPLTQPSTPIQTEPPPASQPEAAASPPRRQPRRASVVEVHASAIAAAAAAAAATAVTTTPADVPKQQQHSPKPEQLKAKPSNHKRRSHDATAALGSPGTLRRQGSRRSTLHVTVNNSQRQPRPAPVPESTVAEPPPSSPSATKPLRHRTAAETEALHRSPSYHAKWRPWMTGRALIEKVGCLQLEELVLKDPTNAHNLVRLGVRYARWPATSLAAALLLEHAAVLHHEPTHGHEYWHALGSAHFDVFLRHRKYLPLARFHLVQSLQALSRALAYLPSLADPLLLLRYAVALYWHQSESSHLERADEIVTELLTKFRAFCDQDRRHVLRFHVQILVRLRRFTEAIEHLTAITTTLHQPPQDSSEYSLQDDLLVLVFCQQSRGDFLHASATLASIGASLVTDQDYVQLWGGVADKCFAHEDYAVALELYAVAASHAKDSRMLSKLAYHHALCYQALGDEIKCTAEFKRARNLHRHVVPLASLAELHAKYDDQYSKLRHTPVPQLIADVQATLYDRAVTALQRIFRRRQQETSQRKSDNSSSVRRPTLPKRTSSSRLGAAGYSSLSLVSQPTHSEEEEQDTHTTLAEEDDPHAAFLRRRHEAMRSLQALRDKQSLAKTRSFHGVSPQSGLLSPLRERPDLQRKHSMDAVVQRLGYIPASRTTYVAHWQTMVATALAMYKSRASLFRHVQRVRAAVPLASEAVACCALADAVGNVDTAIERLREPSYERELQLVCDTVDVMALVSDQLSGSSSSSSSAEPTRFPPIKSPVRSPIKNSSRAASAVSPLPAVARTVRLTSLIDEQVGTKSVTGGGQEEEGPVAVEAAYHLSILADFRTVNASPLHGWQR